jgi:PTH1 family peptidyl-tRNA hydrolase
MKIIVGLGNIGKEYSLTRHNVGFMFVDFLREKFSGSDFKLNKKLEAEICEVDISGEKWFLVKPQTYMNASGRAVNKVLKYYKVSTRELLVVHDDLDIEFGKAKVVFAKGPKVHNGLKSVEKNLGIDFLRLRLGIAGQLYPVLKQKKVSMADEYVLKNFSKDELGELPKVFESILEGLGKELGFQVNYY